ncbi:GNAT family N-acetyltransferase [Yinghuangia sp. YIM S09857]|uniref:GNAT family N-acetyltransferase n=1 Tax=Yinghuangia sp. YIM S09857 TaxID=3436929 RepID=UPI003F535AEF
MSDLEFRSARTLDLDVMVLYRLLRLRVDVFVVEQQCPYPDLDGRDLEPGARQLWLERGGEIAATLRLLRDVDGTARIGRLCAAKAERGSGAAVRLMEHALELVGDAPCILDAQEPLEDWYGRFGFRRAGETYLEDGIPHVEMRRPPAPVAAG